MPPYLEEGVGLSLGPNFDWISQWTWVTFNMRAQRSAIVSFPEFLLYIGWHPIPIRPTPFIPMRQHLIYTYLHVGISFETFYYIIIIYISRQIKYQLNTEPPVIFFSRPTWPYFYFLFVSVWACRWLLTRKKKWNEELVKFKFVCGLISTVIILEFQFKYLSLKDCTQCLYVDMWLNVAE